MSLVLSSLNDLSNASTLNDNDLLLVNQDSLSKKTTYSNLKTSLTKDGFGSSSSTETITKTLPRYWYGSFQLGATNVITFGTEGVSYKVNIPSIISVPKTAVGVFKINGILLTVYNYFDSDPQEENYRYIVYPNDIISTTVVTTTCRISPIINYGGELNSDDENVYSGTMTVLNFFDAWVTNTLSNYSKLFNELNINQTKNYTTKTIIDENGNKEFYSQKFFVIGSLNKNCVLTMVQSGPLTSRLYTFNSDLSTMTPTDNYRYFDPHVAGNSIFLHTNLTGNMYYKMSDMNITFNICNILTEIN